MFSFLSNFKHRQEMRESKDEILVGELIRVMARMHYPAIGFRAGTGEQAIWFKPVQDSVLSSISITVDRKTGGGAIQQALIGSKAVLTVQAEIKNYLADPDDLLNMYKTDIQNIFKVPMLGDIKLDHQLNSVLATKKLLIDIDDYILKGEDSVNRLTQLITATINEMREKIKTYKK